MRLTQVAENVGEILVRLLGIEPRTSGSTIRRSNHLSYNRPSEAMSLRRIGFQFKPPALAPGEACSKKKAGKSGLFGL